MFRKSYSIKTNNDSINESDTRTLHQILILLKGIFGSKTIK